jgi:V/A-type H+-transporting ATPase subunit F
MYKIGIIGDKQSVQGFKAVGLDVFDCNKADEAKRTLHNIADDNYAIIYVTESLYDQIKESIYEYNEEHLPILPAGAVQPSFRFRRVPEQLQPHP